METARFQQSFLKSRSSQSFAEKWSELSTGRSDGKFSIAMICAFPTVWTGLLHVVAAV